ncbi:hypothetical protein [Tengunoibacter tsumagoiensis]|uniref:Type II secretion system protein GspE N-terminal domain-containing protein n=1 Tax=Tengunoibacter tsumagoiensis TaxID=2014871 RepID=A0A402A4H3_9CHLR|nr:hypothetical protein [Tengunoibacter tsumagoiensis]GCE13901.1 hypothetical protein KTT_37600 [Tengunoibacter tsumagoiensis]
MQTTIKTTIDNNQRSSANDIITTADLLRWADNDQNPADHVKRLLQAGATQVALVAITLHFAPDSDNGQEPIQARSLLYFLDYLRPLVRKTDSVCMQGYTYYFFLLDATIHGGEIVQRRLWESLLWCVHNTNEPDIYRPSQMAIGYSAYPAPQKSIQHFLATARIARISFDVPEALSEQMAQAPHQEELREQLKEQSRQLGIPYVANLPRRLPNKVKRLVALQLAQELCCYPLGLERDHLTVAMGNPPDPNVLMRLTQITGMQIFPVLAHPLEINQALQCLQNAG